MYKNLLILLFIIVIVLCKYKLLLLLPLALQPAVGLGLSNNTSPFVPICHQLCPSSHSQHLKISFYFFSPSFPVSSSSSRPFQFLSEDLFGHPVLLHSLQVTQPTCKYKQEIKYFPRIVNLQLAHASRSVNLPVQHTAVYRH